MLCIEIDNAKKNEISGQVLTQNIGHIETLGLVLVSSWSCSTFDYQKVSLCLFIMPEVSGLVSLQNMGNLETLNFVLVSSFSVCVWSYINLIILNEYMIDLITMYTLKCKIKILYSDHLPYVSYDISSHHYSCSICRIGSLSNIDNLQKCFYHIKLLRSSLSYI